MVDSLSAAIDATGIMPVIARALPRPLSKRLLLPRGGPTDTFFESFEA